MLHDITINREEGRYVEPVKCSRRVWKHSRSIDRLSLKPLQQLSSWQILGKNSFTNRGGARNFPTGLKHGYQGTISANISEKIAYHLPTGGL